MASAINLLGKIGFGFTATPDLLINLREFDPGVTREFRDTNATRGTFAKDVNRQRLARTAVAPTFACEPTHLELKHLIPWVMGTTGSGTPLVYDLSNTQTNPLYIYFLPNAGDALLLNDVACDTATFSAAVGEPLSFSAQGVGLTYEEDPSTPTGFGSLTPDQSTQPFMLSDLALTFAGGTVQCREFSVGVNNYVDRNRYLNSQTLTRTQRLNQTMTLTLDVPAGDNADLWRAAVSGTAAATVALSAVFTNANTSKALTFASPAVVFPAQTPTYPPGQEGFLRIQGELHRASGTSYPFRVTMTV